MNILITGSTGLIGQALISELIKPHIHSHPKSNTAISKTADELSITALTRNTGQANLITSPCLSYCSNLGDIDFNHLDVVINLAGEPIADKRWTTKQKEQICESRWSITQTLSSKINAAKTPPHTFISGSAIGYYGRQDETVQVTENYQEIHKEFTHTVCEKWENIAMRASEHSRVCLLRTGIVLDSHKGALAKMLLPFKLGLGGPIANGQQMMSWIHIQDMVAIILELINNETLSGSINATAPNPVSNNEFSKVLSKQLNRPCLFRAPKLVMRLALGEMSDLILYGQGVYPEKLTNTGFQFAYPTLDEAIASLV